jgi:DNA-binding FrmR family transcriptional regulator
MTPETKADLLLRMKRVVGQVAGIEKMIAEDRYCVEILNQIAAARSALDAVGVNLLVSHVDTCLIGHGTGSEHEECKARTPEQMLDEIKLALARFIK